MGIKLGVVMDPIADINYKKDTTLAMLWAAQARDWHLYYMEQGDLYLTDGEARAVRGVHRVSDAVDQQRIRVPGICGLEVAGREERARSARKGASVGR